MLNPPRAKAAVEVQLFCLCLALADSLRWFAIPLRLRSVAICSAAPSFTPRAQLGLLFQLHLPLLKKGVRPVHRFMSAFEQRVEEPNRDYQYVLVRFSHTFA
jgi:hypothetical protein